MKEISYELRQRSQVHIPSVYSVFSGTKSLKFLGPKNGHWCQLKESLEKFRKEIKQWKSNCCPCRPCKRYIPRIGFL